MSDRYMGERRVGLTIRELLAWMRDLEHGSRQRKKQVPGEIRRAIDAAFDAGIILDDGAALSSVPAPQATPRKEDSDE